jgi:hypothetical protein
MNSNKMMKIERKDFNIYVCSDEQELKNIYDTEPKNIKDGFVLFDEVTMVYKQMYI